jgi:hypothetical protein
MRTITFVDAVTRYQLTIDQGPPVRDLVENAGPSQSSYGDTVRFSSSTDNVVLITAT